MARGKKTKGKPSARKGEAGSARSAYRARIAIHDSAAALPEIIDVTAAALPDFLSRLTAQVNDLISQRGGRLPELAVKEVLDNLIHADFRGIAIDLRQAGNLLVVSDRGEGIPDRERALLPGYSSASDQARQFIRGVGSGLPLVKQLMESVQGRIALDSNLGTGTIVTLSAQPGEERPAPRRVERPRLSERHRKILLLLAELGEAGPSAVSKELSISLTTAHRDLSALEGLGLVQTQRGKRTLTQEGVSSLDVVFK